MLTVSQPPRPARFTAEAAIFNARSTCEGAAMLSTRVALYMQAWITWSLSVRQLS